MVTTLRDPLSRTPGVGSIQIFGSGYAMRIWLDPNKLNSFQLTPSDVAAAIKAQNHQVAVGNLGGAPSVAGQQVSATMMARTMMSSPEEFAEILLKVKPDGAQIRLKDVARVEIGAENYSRSSTFNNQPAAGMAIMLATGANALATAEAVKAKIAELEPYFPAGDQSCLSLRYHNLYQDIDQRGGQDPDRGDHPGLPGHVPLPPEFPGDPHPDHRRAGRICSAPSAIMAVFGYSINTMTMFGLVLAIGLLVDDAIVVVENVERIMAEEGLSPLEATRKSMDQITGALIGIALVLSAVFVPMAFFGGSTGAIYRQFSLTIVSAMVLSVLVALILTPALCATLLKPVQREDTARNAAFSAGSTAFLSVMPTGTAAASATSSNVPAGFGIVYLLLIGGMVFFFTKLPTSFIPEEDQGVFLTMVQLPAGATLERTQKVLQYSARSLSDQGSRQCQVGLCGRRLQFCRSEPEHRHGLRPADGLERAE